MKKELLLTAMITASITTTGFAASNLDISATTAAPLSMKNSIAYGGDNKVEQGMFSPVKIYCLVATRIPFDLPLMILSPLVLIILYLAQGVS